MAVMRALSVVRTWSETPGLLGVELDAPRSVIQLHERPGQIVMLQPPGAPPIPVVITSAPGEPIELLLGNSARGLLGGELPAALEVGPPLGPGFPLDAAEDKDVLVFAVGRAVGAARAVLDCIVKQRGRFRRVLLYAGARALHDHAFRGRDETWHQAGIEVRRTIGRPWVQEVFEQEPFPLHEAFAFVAGTRPMIEGVRQVLVRHGLPLENFALNW